MIRLILQPRPHIHQESLHLRNLPPQHIRKHIQAKALNPHLQRHAIHLANLLQRLVGRPRTHRHLQVLLLNVLKPGLSQPADVVVVVDDLESLAHFGAGLLEDVDPGLEDVPRGHGGVVGVDAGPAVHVLEPAAGLEAAVGLAVDGDPVLEGAGEVADVDVVEGVFGVGPGLGGVVELELAVGRHPRGLDGREVDAGDFGVGELVGEVDGPDAGAGADVEHLGGLV